MEKAIPVDSLPLEGAQIVAVAGGGAKRRDLQKGFAIIDSKGRKRFFIAETYAQYEMWVAALSKTLSSQNHHTNGTLVNNLEKDEALFIGNDSDNDQASDDLQSDSISIPDTQSSISENASNDGISESFEITKKLNFREKAKNRMSQIGTSMKSNVKIDKSATGNLNFNRLRSDSNSIPENQSLSENASNDGTSESLEVSKKLNFREKAKNRMSQIGTSMKNNVKIDKNAAGTLRSDTDSIPDTQSLSENTSNDESSESFEGAKKLKFREKAKNRMSQIGTAVKNNVKIDKNAIRQLNSGTFQNMHVKPNTSNTNRLPQDSPLKIRGLTHCSEVPEIKEKIIHRDQKMCTITGFWVAKVHGIKPDDHDDQNSISKAKVSIHLQCMDWKGHEHEKPSDIYITKDFSELIKFHADVSDGLLAIRHDLKATGFNSMNQDTKDTLFAQVLHSGRLLKGLLFYHEKENNTHMLDSVCKFEDKALSLMPPHVTIDNNNIPFSFLLTGDISEQFINAILSEPLPTIVFQLSVVFLCMQNQAIIESTELIGESRPNSLSDSLSLPDYERDFAQIVSLVQTCKGTISHANRQAVLANKLASERLDCSIKSKKQQVTLAPIQKKYSIALHDALLAVMVERDGAQSQLMAERVFHTHELDQERRKIEMLEKKIDYLKKALNEGSSSAAAFFLGQEEIPNKNSLNKIEKSMVQNVDAELMELCRQLSSEISSRVSSELEVLRLRESRKIEREMESVERKMLDDQVNYYKKKMEEAQAERDTAIRETVKWKTSFEKLVAIDPNIAQPVQHRKP